jgi:hypothetical protein
MGGSHLPGGLMGCSHLPFFFFFLQQNNAHHMQQQHNANIPTAVPIPMKNISLPPPPLAVITMLTEAGVVFRAGEVGGRGGKGGGKGAVVTI